jgi:hypothetical protein
MSALLGADTVARRLRSVVCGLNATPSHQMPDLSLQTSRVLLCFLMIGGQSR